MVRLLLEREGVDPNNSDNNGGTPLFYAAGFGREGAVKLLLQRDVSLNKPEKEGRTPLWFSTELDAKG